MHKGSGAAMPLRRQTINPPKRSLLDEVDLEEDCGFKFRRISKPAEDKPVKLPANFAESTQLVKKVFTEMEIPVAQASPKQGRDRERRRRRSSFATIVSRSTSRPSSFSVSLSQRLPAASVSVVDYHKHLMPDLPGPIKMRQLLLWAAQRAATRQKNPLVLNMAESVVQALFSNMINTSWYQRPAIDNTVTIPPTGPKNQELSDCIQLYERYAEKLRQELKEWHQIKENAKTAISHRTFVALPCEVRPPNMDVRKHLENLSEWFVSLPTATDRLNWTLSIAASFEAHARTYCESVHQQIRTRLCGGDMRPAPMMLLRALSTANSK